MIEMGPDVVEPLREYLEEGKKTIDAEALSFDKETGELFPAMVMGNYLGLEAKGRKNKWTEEIEKMKKFNRGEGGKCQNRITSPARPAGAIREGTLAGRAKKKTMNRRKNGLRSGLYIFYRSRKTDL